MDKRADICRDFTYNPSISILPLDMIQGFKNKLIKGISTIDVPLLLFLASIVHIKLYIKLAAIVFYCGWLLYKRYNFQRKADGPVWFYLLMIPLGLLGAWLSGSLGEISYWRGFAIGALKWGTAAAACYIIMVAVQRLTKIQLITTIQAFFFINALVSAIDLGIVMVDSQRWIPYWITDSQFYGISTGDHIRGLTRDNSITNAALNLLGVIFFLYRKRISWALLCLIVAIMCTSNFSMMLLILCLITSILIVRDNKVKLYAAIFIIFSILLYAFLSMQNIAYSNKTLKKEITKMGSQTGPSTFSLRSSSTHINEETGENEFDDSTDIVTDLRKIQAHIRANGGGRLDTATARATILAWYGVPFNQSTLAESGTPGKLYALMQAGSYMCSGVGPFLVGAGTGNFASNLAIKMTGLGIHGNYPPQYIYAHENFVNYHLYIWLYSYSYTAEFQSVTQLPANVYSQLGGEYGIIGVLLFIIFYVFYFLKRNQFRVEALVMTAMLLGYFFVDYWFEMISLTVLFELLMSSGVMTANPKKRLTTSEKKNPSSDIQT